MTVVRNTNGEKIVLLEEQEEIIEKARFCKLDGFAEELQYQFINPLQYKDSSYESRISGCLDSQISANKNAQFNAYFKKSHMPRKYYLSKYQDDPERNLNRKDIQYLKELNYINAGTNIIINGPTGTGKTALPEEAQEMHEFIRKLIKDKFGEKNFGEYKYFIWRKL